MRIARTIAKDGVAHLRAALAAPLASRQFSDITAEEAKSVYSSIERDASLSKFKGKDWWAAAPNKAEIFDTPEAQEIVTNYFSSLEAVCVSEEAKREVKKSEFSAIVGGSCASFQPQIDKNVKTVLNAGKY